MEEKHGSDRTWEKIIDSNGNVFTDTANIQRVQLEFYTDLYTSSGSSPSEIEENVFLDAIDMTLSPEKKTLIDQDISLDELTDAKGKMKNNKSPGPDGIIIEFYKEFWEIIKDDFFEMVVISLATGNLPFSQYLALITL